MATVTICSDFGAQKTVSPSICHEVMGPDDMILYIENPKETTRKLLELINKYQSWVLIGRTDVEAENTILWPPDAKS